MRFTSRVRLRRSRRDRKGVCKLGSWEEFLVAVENRVGIDVSSVHRNLLSAEGLHDKARRGDDDVGFEPQEVK